jgi:hypothetical protein
VRSEIGGNGENIPSGASNASRSATVSTPSSSGIAVGMERIPTLSPKCTSIAQSISKSYRYDRVAIGPGKKRVEWTRRVCRLLTAAFALYVIVAGSVAPNAAAVTTTTTLWSHVGNGQQVPPPSSIDLFQGDTLFLQGVIQYGGPAGVTLPNPTGSISFYDGGQLLGTVALTQGQSICNTLPCTVWQAAFNSASLTVGAHPITAVYSGDGLFGSSTSTLVTANVIARPPLPPSLTTTTTLWSHVGNGQQVPPPSSIDLFQGDTLFLQGVIQYSGPAGVTLPNPTGSISFYDGAQLLGTVALTQGQSICNTLPCTVWQAAFNSASLTVGAHPITAVYSGDGLFGSSTSTLVTANVVARPPSPITQFTGLTATNTGQAILSVSGGGPTCGIVRGEYLAISGGTDSPSVSPPPGLVFPHGLVAFVVGGCAPGSTINIELSLPTPVPPGIMYWKFGSTPDNGIPHWYSIPVSVQGSKISFSIVDGKVGDDDLTANGTVIDAGGPAFAEVTAPDAIPTMSEWLIVVMALLIALSGAAFLNRQRCASDATPPQRRRRWRG